MERPIYELHAEKIMGGLNYSMLVYEDRVVVQTRYTPSKAVTILSFGMTKWQKRVIDGDITTYISEMTTVTLNKGGASHNGKIAFSVPGKNDNTVGTGMYFRAEDNDTAEKIANFLNSAIHREKTGGGGSSAADEIRKLKGLLDEGIITQGEFDRKKAQLLGL
jgi:hypothetical protein